MTLKIILTHKNFTKKILQFLNENEFTLTSLVLQKAEYDSRESYEFESYHRDLEEFFMKHGSSLRSLKLNLWLHPYDNPEYNSLEIASRRGFFSRD